MATRRTPRGRPPIHFADPEEVRDFAAGLSESELECRELGHLWRRYNAAWSDTEGCFHRVLRCSRCKTEREQRLSDKGTVLTNQYHYPEGYLHAGMGRIAGDAKDVLRLASVTHQVAFTDRKKDQAKRRRKAG